MMWPVRVELLPFAATWYGTGPGPLLVEPVPRVSQGTSLTAVHGHAASVCTDTLPWVCPGPASAPAGSRTYVHVPPGPAPGPACRTSTRRPAMSSDPDLGSG